MPNSTIYKPQFSIPNNQIRAFASKHLNEYTFAIVNQSAKDETFQINENFTTGNSILFVYEYSENNRPVNAMGFPVFTKKHKHNFTKKNFEISVKPKSVVFVSTKLIK